MIGIEKKRHGSDILAVELEDDEGPGQGRLRVTILAAKLPKSLGFSGETTEAKFSDFVISPSTSPDRAPRRPYFVISS